VKEIIGKAGKVSITVSVGSEWHREPRDTLICNR
jgi:hypothetical protein